MRAGSRVALLCLLLASCEEKDTPAREGCGPVRQRCQWNEATQQFDRNCVAVPPPDGGAVDCDGGALVLPARR